MFRASRAERGRESTFIGMVYGMIRRTSGELRVFGLDPTTWAREIKKRLGVVIQENALDESLTVAENMRVRAAFVGVSSKEREAKIQSLSGGMKRRLAFVRALLSRPELLN